MPHDLTLRCTLCRAEVAGYALHPWGQGQAELYHRCDHGSWVVRLEWDGETLEAEVGPVLRGGDA